jgi:DNA-binding CsgD family transcriptional regulator
MIELWDCLLTLLRTQRTPASRYFELDEPLYTALVSQANREQRPVEQLQAELLAAGLAHLQTLDGLQQRWGTLSQREQQVTALTCLGYTNRQMAAHMQISLETVKTHISNALIKFGLHSKTELRLALSEWDFSEWDPPQP